MEILQLQYFCAAAELQNFTLAAKRYYIPQSAMSITIKRLETELGTQLFDRIGNRIYLNEAGKQFYTHAKNCIVELQNAKDSVQLLEAPCGEIRLLVLEERHAIADLVIAFQKIYPRIRFFISHKQSEQSISSFDMIVNSKQLNHNSITAPIIKESFVLALSKSHRLSKRKKIHLQELSHEEFIMFPPGYSSHHLAVEACKANGFTPKINILCDEPICMKKYIEADLGIAFVPYNSWKNMSDNITLVSLEGYNFTRTTILEVCNGHLTSRAAKLFFEYCTGQTKL